MYNDFITSGFEKSTTQYTLECDRQLNFSIGDPFHCHNYSIADDEVCELYDNTTQFGLRLSLFNNGIQIQDNLSVARVVIDDSEEPECCKFC